MEPKSFRKMNMDEIVVMSILNKHKDVSNLEDELLTSAGGWVLKAIKKRLDAYELAYDVKTIIALLTVGDGVVGKCADQVDYVAQWCKANKMTKLTYTVLLDRIYIIGVPIF